MSLVERPEGVSCCLVRPPGLSGSVHMLSARASWNGDEAGKKCKHLAASVAGAFHPPYLSRMVTQNFAATAAYFERRAAKASAAGMRRRLEAAAAHYRSLAELYGHGNGRESGAGSLLVVPPRRQRLIELFQAGNNVSALLVLGRQGHGEEP
jgi:hypothetical protein